jgi:hypothetical protein
MTNENMRREARYDVRMPVVVHRGRVVNCLETFDVSFKGLFVCTSDPPPLRSLVRLTVTLGERSFEVHAMAVHVVRAADGARPAGVGLQFWGLSGPDRAAWDDFVRGLMPARAPAPRAPGFPLTPMTPVTPMTPSGVRVVATPVTTPATPHLRRR